MKIEISCNEEIFNIDKVITDNMERLIDERGLLSQNMLAQLRNLVEAVILKEYIRKTGEKLDISYESKQKARNQLIFTKENRFLFSFHRFLQMSKSHYTFDYDQSERLMIKYYEYLVNLKNFLYNTYDLDIFSNLNLFPLNLDNSYYNFYKSLYKVMDHLPKTVGTFISLRYYVQSVKPIVVNKELNKIYYEITLTTGTDQYSKFDQMLVYSKKEIQKNYAIKISYVEREVFYEGYSFPTRILVDYIVSIRPSEINHLGAILGFSFQIKSQHQEYKYLMEFLTKNGIHLLELVLNDFYFQTYQKEEIKNSTHYIINTLKEAKKIITKNMPGANVVRYLLFVMQNRILKDQYSKISNSKLSSLYLNKKCNPFDQMPFSMSLSNHNPKWHDLFLSIPFESREDELIARKVKKNADQYGILYTDYSLLAEDLDVNSLVKYYNQKVSNDSQILLLDSYAYLKNYEDSTLYILKKLYDLTQKKEVNYNDKYADWISRNEYLLESSVEKVELLNTLFETSKVAIINGAAGTGKTTLIEYFSQIYEVEKVIFLTNTNTALNHLKKRVNNKNSQFYTIRKFIKNGAILRDCTALVIDECSNINNKDMQFILENSQFSVLLLVGDPCQIEPIGFGNWFSFASRYFEKNCVFSLQTVFRTEEGNLKLFWQKVRDKEDAITEFLAKTNISRPLDFSLISNKLEDEIILCLNYSGVFGINNLNQFFQNQNPGKKVNLGIKSYKVGDPVLFEEIDRFAPYLYNNMKGIICDMADEPDKVWFTILLDQKLNVNEENLNFEILDSSEKGKTKIRFFVQKFLDKEEEASSLNVVPFSVSYAVSIHKAQGLEYDSVKIILPNDMVTLITSPIFYTAITRAKKNLKIFWSPETQDKVLKRICERADSKDYHIIKNKLDKEINVEKICNEIIK